MRLPILNPIRKTTVTTGSFAGLNQKLIVGDGEFSDMQNMSDRDYPAISTREKRGGTVQTLTKANGLLVNENIWTVDGTTLKRNGSAIGGTLTDSKKTMVSMGRKVIVFPDLKEADAYNVGASLKDLTFSFDLSQHPVEISGNNNGSYISISPKIPITSMDSISLKADDIIRFDVPLQDGVAYEEPYITFAGTSHVVSYVSIQSYETLEGEVTYFEGIGVKTPYPGDISGEFVYDNGILYKDVPTDVSFVIECNNRLWGCMDHINNNEIRASKLGDAGNWGLYEGTAMDSYALSIGPDGPFTGGIAYNNNPVFFKEDWIFTIYGDKPSNFQLNAKNLPGAKYNDSLVIINDILYYVGRDGVYAYDGVSPKKISENIVQKITDAAASQEDEKYYLSCKLNNVQTLLVYDTKTGLWDKEDGTKFDFCSYGQGELYYIENNVLKTIKGNASETINFYMESGDIIESSIDEKYVSKFKFNIQLDAGSEATIYLNCDDEGFKRYGNIISTAKNTYTFPIIPKRCNKYRWRIEGKGQVKLLGVQRTIEGGTEINAVRPGI